MKRNVVKIIEDCRKSGRITARYDMRVADVIRIREFCHDDYELITRSFIFGYAQGYKAALKNSQKK